MYALFLLLLVADPPCVSASTIVSFNCSTNTSVPVPPAVVQTARYVGTLVPVILPLPLRVMLFWINLRGAALGYSLNNMYRNVTNNIPAALYISQYGQQLSGYDITIQLDSSARWYLGQDCNTPSNEYDFASVILHEIVHGLGFRSLFYSNDGVTFKNDNRPPDQLSFFDLRLGCTKSTNVTACLRGGMYFRQYNGDRVTLYAPSTWSASSIMHLDPNVYSSTSIDGLMTPSLIRGSCHHTVGPIVSDMLLTLGYQVTFSPDTQLPTNAPTLTLASDAEIFVCGLVIAWTVVMISLC